MAKRKAGGARAPGAARPAVMKPAYRIPSIAEIRAIPLNGYKVVSTFSGCGGSCLGYRMAGFDVVWMNEFVEAARETYAANSPDTFRDGRDIRDVTPASIVEDTGIPVGGIDLLDGSPPCASFSMCGAREAHWGDVKAYSGTKQRTDDLFDEYLRLLDGLKPRTFVAENVAGLLRGTAKGYFLYVLNAMQAIGYRVVCRLLDAEWLGVPQSRKRTIFVGVRNDLAEAHGVEPVHPAPLPYRYSARDAIPWIRIPGGGPPVEPETNMEPYASGAAWHEMRGFGESERFFQLYRTDDRLPVHAITAAGGNASTASVAHPHECRKFSIAELRRLCGFPDDFILTGSYAEQYERLGRAVPPVMMAAVAGAIRDRILNRIPAGANPAA